MGSPNPLGFVPLIPIIAKAVPAIVSLIGGKKKKKAEAYAAQLQAGAEQIASGQAVMATAAMTENDKAFLRRVWPKVHVAANWSDINWGAVGEPQGAQLTPAAEKAISIVWPQVHIANAFDDVTWQYHAVPVDQIAALLPVPELPSYMQPAQSGRTLIDSRTGLPIKTASIFGDIPQEYLIAGAVGVGLLLLFSRRR